MTKKDFDIIEFLREQMHDFRPLPPPDIWAFINDQLDIEDVWESLEKKLVNEQGKKYYFPVSARQRWKLISGMAAASVLILLGLYILSLRNGKEESVISEFTYYEDTQKEDPGSTPEIALRDALEPGGQLKELLHSSIQGNPENSLTIDPSGTDDELVIHKEFGSQLAYIPSYNPPLKVKSSDNPNEKDWTLPREDKVTLETQRNNNTNLSKWKFGISTQVKNHWLLNQTTFNGLKSYDLTTTIPDFGISFQLMLGRQINPLWEIQVESDFFDYGGQTYYQYINGHYVHRSIDLHYLSFQTVVLRHKRNHISGMPGNGNYLIGLYGSYLSQANEKIDNHPESNISRTYHRTDFGLILGYEQQVPISPKIEFSPGVRFHFGLPNVYKGTDVIPAYLYQTSRASFRLQLGFKYRL